MEHTLIIAQNPPTASRPLPVICPFACGPLHFEDHTDFTFAHIRCPACAWDVGLLPDEARAITDACRGARPDLDLLITRAAQREYHETSAARQEVATVADNLFVGWQALRNVLVQTFREWKEAAADNTYLAHKAQRHQDALARLRGVPVSVIQAGE